MEGEVERNKNQVNYNVNNIGQTAVNELEAETKEMALAAQATIQTLQGIIEEKTEELDRRDRTIDSLRNELSQKIQMYKESELGADRQRRDKSDLEREKMSIAGTSSMKVLERVSAMGQKELERLVMDYEGRLKMLSDELSECEISNQELITKLRETRLEMAKMENSMVKQSKDDEQTVLKREVFALEEVNKKKNKEQIKQKKLTEELKKELIQNAEERVVQEDVLTKNIMKDNQSIGEVEARLKIMTNKYQELSNKIKAANKTIEGLKQEEIKSREKQNGLLEQNSKLMNTSAKQRTEVEKLRKENGELRAKNRTAAQALPKPNEPIINTGPNGRRVESAKQGPNRPGQKTPDQDSQALKSLKENILFLEEENKGLKNKLTPEFIDGEGNQVSVDTMSYENLPAMYKGIKDYMQYFNPRGNLHSILKMGDKNLQGVMPKAILLDQLEQAGIRFKERDRNNFQDWVPADKYDCVDYLEMYYQIHGKASKNSDKTDGGVSTNKKGQGTPVKEKDYDVNIIPPHLTKLQNEGRKSVYEGRSNRGSVLDPNAERNLETMKNKVKALEDENVRLEKQVGSWKEKALKAEAEDFDRSNRQSMLRNNLGVNGQPSERVSQFGGRSTLGGMGGDDAKENGAMLRMIRELEDKLNQTIADKEHLRKSKDFEITDLMEELRQKEHEIAMLTTESRNQRQQISNILSDKLSNVQQVEEKDKEKEFVIASLMQKLENARDREKLMHDKAKNLEKENLELNYVKENFDNKIEKLNRRIRELEDSYMNKANDAY